MKNALLLLSLAAVSLLCLGTDCHRNLGPVELRYAFRTNVTISPLKRTYTLADTIWLEADINGKMLYDTISRQLFNTDSAALTASAAYAQLAATTTNPADGFCQILAPDINNIYRSYFKGVSSAAFTGYGCNRSNLKWRIGIKPNYRGTYGLFLNTPDVYLQTCQTSSTAIPFYSAHSYRFSSPNLNQDIYAALPDSARRNDTYTASSFTSGLANHTAFIIKVE